MDREIAVGRKEFVEQTKEHLGVRARGRQVIETRGAALCEPRSPYSTGFEGEKGLLRLENTHFWNIYPEIS